MVKNTCTPANVFGPFNQTLFCGASVLSFSASAGWNSQQGECTVTVVEDDCPGTKTYWDKNLIKQTTSSADPGFTFPSIGSPAMFRIAEFEFAGLIQSWRETNSPDGKPTFEVKLVDPREILEGTQIIISDYAGSVGTLYNIINAFGFMESFGVACPAVSINGANFGTLAGGYGGAKVNSNGMSWNRIKDSVSLLTAAFPAQINNFSPYGRLIFKGCEPNKNGYGVISHDLFDPSILIDFPNHHGYLAEYMVDLSEVPSAPNFWRVAGPSVNLLDLITNVCATAGCDFYIELIPIVFGGNVQKFIKIRTVARNSQPILGQISSFINNVTQGVLNDAVGEELRNESTTSFIIGDNVQSIYQASNGVESGIVEPYWGTDNNGDVIVATLVGGEYIIPTSFVKLNNELFNPMPTSTGEITETELRMALSGYDQWLAYVLGKPTDFGDKIADRGGISKHLYDLDNVAAIFDALTNLGNKITPRQLLHLRQFLELQDTELKDLSTIYETVANYAREFYGRKYQVHLPFTCAYLDPEGGNFFTSEEPSLDGGWTETTTVIGLNHPTLTLPFETDHFGKLGPFVAFLDGTGLEYPDTNQEDFVFSGGTLYIKADIEEQFVYTDRSTFTGPRAVLTLQEPILNKAADTDDLDKAAQALETLLQEKRGDADAEKLKEVIKNVGSQHILYELEGKPAIPDKAAVPLRSNILTYGPWFVRGPAGRAQMTQDVGLVPWEYGSISNMNTAGLAKVTDAVTLQQVVENGNITVAGYPDIPLGAEIGAKAGGFFGAGKHLIENRSLTISTFTETLAGGGVSNINYRRFTYGGWTGLYGPNVTNVSVSAEANGVETTYTMRTFTPQFGRFAKANVERFAEIGRQRLERLKGRKFNRNLQARSNALIRRLQERDRIVKVTERDGRKRTSPVDVFVAQQLRWPKVLANNDELFRNNIVEAIPYHELHAEFTKYNKKAFMSLDGFFRPVSKAGDNGLPQYISPTGTQCSYQPHISEQPQPPIIGYTPVIINTSYLDPVLSPSDAKHGTSDGHDIDVLGRGDTPPASSISTFIDKAAGGPGYENDYRFLAWKGPVLLTQWGYDLQGKPVPNAADTESAASGGEFTDINLQDIFLEDWLRKSHTWPVAPIDLRLDRKRGVWTVPSSFRILRATVDINIPVGSSGEATPTNLGSIYDANGNLIVNPKINISSPDVTLSAGQKINAYWDSDDCTYYPITASGGGAGSGVIISDWGCDCTTNSIQNVQASHLIFGTGLDVVSGRCDGGGGSNTYTILGGVQIQNTLGVVSVSSYPDRARTLIFGEGIDTEDLGNCEVLVTAPGQLLITDTQCTCTINPEVSSEILSHIYFGTGLDVISGSCNGNMNPGAYTVLGGIKMELGTDCPLIGTTINGQRGEKIELHKGLKGVYDSGNCLFKIGAFFNASTVGCPLIPTAPTGFNELRFGPGLVTEQINDCVLAFDTNLTVNSELGSALFVNDITLGCGLSGTIGTCSTEIAVNPLSNSGMIQEAKLVTDVFCTGNDITVELTTFRFSQCGLFIGSG